MKKLYPYYLLLILSVASCQEKNANLENTVPTIEKVSTQYEYLYQNAMKFWDTETPMPRTIVDGKLHSVGIYEKRGMEE